MGARPFEWSDLEIFLATARGGTLAAGAAALGVDASTVQRRIAKLEAAMRTRLFDRSVRGYSLTTAGEDLLAHASTIEAQVDAAQRQVAARDAALVGTVRVASVDDFAITVLSPIVRTFRDKHPRVVVSVDVRPDFSDLGRRQADVAVRIGAKPTDDDVVARRVCRVGVGLYASRDYLARHGRPARLEDLREHALVCGEADHASAIIDRTIGPYVDPARVAVTSQSLFARLAAIRDGAGVGMVGCFMGDREAGLERLPFAFPEVRAELWMVVHVDMQRTARVSAFFEHVYAALLAQRSLFEGAALG